MVGAFWHSTGVLSQGHRMFGFLVARGRWDLGAFGQGGKVHNNLACNSKMM